ncbi:hypothetical protein ABZW10_32870 [Kitasatospora sp. NPDC004723]|uniref:hypothetical protein n=1 Tax=Kitasatospora sp. NPDC004723 TaxID=3154288 RepID=UPI0033BAD893
MTRRTATQRRARQIQDAEGIGYHDALIRARAEQPDAAQSVEQPAAEPTVEELFLAAFTARPTAAEAAAGVTVGTLGVRALAADATPAHRARAEATFCTSAGPDRPCRCSGTGCHQGAPCPDAEEGCEGRLVHVDRYPGSMWGLTEWWDSHQCTGCGAVFEGGVELPEIPWGELRESGTGQDGRPTSVTVVYDGVRHPNFPDGDAEDGLDDGPGYWLVEEDDLDPDPDDLCDECGGTYESAAHTYECVC